MQRPATLIQPHSPTGELSLVSVEERLISRRREGDVEEVARGQRDSHVEHFSQVWNQRHGRVVEQRS